MQKSIYCQTEGKNIFNLSKNPYFNKPHLSKAMSGFKQKCSQFPTSFSGTVFHALSHGLIHFVWRVSPRNHFMIGENSLTVNQRLLLRWFLKLTLQKNWIIPLERPWKTMRENGVHFCLRSLLGLERCGKWNVGFIKYQPHAFKFEQ